MSKLTKRVLSLLIVAFMVISMIPANVSAAETGSAVETASTDKTVPTEFKEDWCYACNKEVTWVSWGTAWKSTQWVSPTDHGHIYLTGNTTYVGDGALLEGATCFHTNGYTLSPSDNNTGATAFNMRARLNLMGDGTIIGNGGSALHVNHANADVHIYGPTLKNWNGGKVVNGWGAGGAVTLHDGLMEADANIADLNNVALTVNGGKIKAGYLTTWSTAVIEINGGTIDAYFKGDNYNQITVGEGYTKYQIPDPVGTLVVADDADHPIVAGYGYCEACESVQKWTAVTSLGNGKELTGGHYYLTGDTTYVGDGAFVKGDSCFHNNGYTLSPTDGNTGATCFNMQARLNLMGNGTIYGNGNSALHVNNAKADVHIYSGTIKNDNNKNRVILGWGGGGTVTLHGGLILGQNGYNMADLQNIKLIVEGGKISGKYLHTYSDTSVVINGGTVDAYIDGDASRITVADGYVKNTLLNVSGTYVTKADADTTHVSENGYGYCEACEGWAQWTAKTSFGDGANGHVYMTGNATYTGDAVGVYDGYVTCFHTNGYTLEPSTVDGGATAFSVRAKLNLLGNGTIVGNGASAVHLGTANADVNIYGPTLKNFNNDVSTTVIFTWGVAGKVTLHDGLLTSAGEVANVNTYTLTVKGGTVNGKLTTSNGGTIAVSGGKFSENVTQYCAEGYHTVKSGEYYVYGAHSYDAGVVTNPTCTAGGYTTYTCACGHSYEGNQTPAANHNYKPVTVVAPTCDADGYTVYTCEACGDSYNGNITSATGHSYESKIASGEIASAADCDNNQAEYVKCDNCTYVNKEMTVEIPETATGHNYSDWEYVDEDNHKRVCINDESHVETKAHSYGTSWDDGKKTCSDCGHVLNCAHEYGRPVSKDAQNHTVTCTICGVSEIVAHNLETVDAQAPTCTQPGWDAYVYCKDYCGYTTYNELPAKHNGTYVAAKAATCTEAGNIEHWACTACEKNFSDADCTQEIIGSVVTEIDENAHKWGEGVQTKAPTCSAVGVMTYTCEHNGEHTYTDDIAIDENAHKWGEGVQTKAPTCSAVGVMTYTCEHNGEHTYTDDIAIDENAHKYVSVETAPTCTEAGYTTYTCEYNAEHTYTVDGEPATDHAYEIVVGEYNETQHKLVCKNDESHIDWEDHNGNATCDCGFVAETIVTSLAELNAALAAGGEFKLGANITWSGIYAVEWANVPAGVNAVMDLNGYTITQTTTQNAGLSMAAFVVRSGATLTVKDSSDAQTGTISACITAFQNEGTVILESGKILIGENCSGADITPNQGCAYGVWMYARNDSTTPTFIMNGGSIEINDAMLAAHAENGDALAVASAEHDTDALAERFDNVTVKINGGTINAPITASTGATVTVADGIEAEVVRPVAEIDGVEYLTLADAIEAAKNGGTVELLTDIQLEGDDNIQITEGMDITFTGNYTISGNDGFYVTGGKLTLGEGLTVIANVYNPVYIRGGEVITSANLIAKDIYSAIQGNGNFAGNVTVKGGNITAEKSTAIYWPHNGTLTVEGGNITGLSGIEMRAGTLKMTDGTVTATAALSTQDYSNGTTVDGAAVALSQHNTNLPVEINITGGELIATDAAGVAFYQGNHKTNGAPSTDISATIDADVVIEGKVVVEEDYKMVNGVLTAKNYVAEVVGGAKYESLAVAIEEAPEGATVTVIAGHEITAPVVIEKNITIDLGNKTLTGVDVYPVIRVQSGATVTIKNGSIINETDYVFVLGSSDVETAGNLIIESGYYKGNTTVASVTKGVLTINDGKFETAESEYGSTYLLNCYDPSCKDGSAKIVVNGGEFVDFNPYDNKAEDPKVNFVKDGFHGELNADGNYVIAKHSYTETVVPPTCTEAGYTTYTCACGHTYTDDYVDATDHAWDNATPNDDGTHTVTCGNDPSHTDVVDCSIVDGVCTECGYVVPFGNAYIVVDGVKTYGDVQDLLKTAGEVVVFLHKNADLSGDFVVIRNGKTLDLNGFTLTTDEVLTSSTSGKIIDSSNGAGLLKVARENLTLASNAQMMVWIAEDGGYRFANVSFTGKLVNDESIAGKAKYSFWLDGTDPDYIIGKELGDGAEDNDGMELIVRVSYTNNSGKPLSLDVSFAADDLMAYGNNYYKGSLYVIVSGLDNVSNVTFTPILTNGDVVITGAPAEYK